MPWSWVDLCIFYMLLTAQPSVFHFIPVIPTVATTLDTSVIYLFLYSTSMKFRAFFFALPKKEVVYF